MDPSTKGGISLLFISFSAAVIGLRLQQPLVIFLGLAPIVVAIVWNLSRVASVLILVFLGLLYPAPQAGYLFGYDSHSAAMIARSVQSDGWPISDVLFAWGFPGTPLLHFHAALVSTLTGLPIYPHVSPRPLVTSLLPFVYVGTVLASIAVFARAYTKRSRSCKSHSMTVTAAVLTVGLYLPLYDKKIAFRRHSLALALFAIAFLLFYQYVERRDRRLSGLLLVFSICLVITHHLTSVMFTVLLGIYAMLYFITYSRSGSNYVSKGTTIVVFVVSWGFIWYLIAGYGGELVLAAVFRTFSGIFLTDPLTVPREISIPFMTSWRNFYSPWLYQILPAGLITAGWFLRKKVSETDFWLSYTFMVGGFTAAFAVSMIGLVYMNSFRLILLYMVIGGWIAPFVIWDLEDTYNISGSHLMRVFVLGLLLFSISMIPPHLVADTEPTQQSVRSERFDTSLYATAWFLHHHRDESVIVGDTAVREILQPTTQLPVRTRYRQIENTEVPERSYVVLRDKNRYLYWGKSPTSSGPAYAELEPGNLVQRFVGRHSVIYSSRDARIFVNGSQSTGEPL